MGLEGAGNKAINYDGGAIYCQPSTVFSMNYSSGIIQYNEAGQHGGALALGGTATATMTAGTISHNKAGIQGGGIYIPSNATLNISGSAVISDNDATGQGGGVYVAGTMNVSAGSLAVRNNTINGSVPCNVYLLSGKTINVNGDGFDPEYLGIYTVQTTTPIPVITGTAARLGTIYAAMQANTMDVFDDKQLYSPNYTSGQTTIYFENASPWSLLQQQARASSDLHIQDGVCQISDVKSLTAFLWYVNGITKHSSETEFSTTHASAQGVLTADIDMGSHY